jgi:hypothetical protein
MEHTDSDIKSDDLNESEPKKQYILIYNNERLKTFKGYRPKQAAGKAFSFLIANFNVEEAKFKLIDSENKEYCYNGEKVKLDEPVIIHRGIRDIEHCYYTKIRQILQF